MPKNRGLHDRESKRDDIVAAAREMFVSDGFERASISRLAKAVGITPNTVYWYFDDKDDILVAVLMLAAYGYPIAQFFIDPPPQAVVHRLG